MYIAYPYTLNIYLYILSSLLSPLKMSILCIALPLPSTADCSPVTFVISSSVFNLGRSRVACFHLWPQLNLHLYFSFVANFHMYSFICQQISHAQHGQQPFRTYPTVTFWKLIFNASNICFLWCLKSSRLLELIV